jgi:hypothetical protein
MATCGSHEIPSNGPGDALDSLAAGADGNLWFTEGLGQDFL